MRVFGSLAGSFGVVVVMLLVDSYLDGTSVLRLWLVSLIDVAE